MKNTVRNSGHLCSIYCPDCRKVTDRVSWNLLREAGKVKAVCPICGGITMLEYDGKTAIVYHIDSETDTLLHQVMMERKKTRIGDATK